VADYPEPDVTVDRIDQLLAWDLQPLLAAAQSRAAR
jgi:hypothetical protein